MDFARFAAKRRAGRRGAALVAIGVAVVLAMTGYVNAGAGASPSSPEHTVTLCHATASRTNPYVVITVDVASVLNEGHDRHDGPVFTPDLPKQTAWGDIIPPFDFGGAWTYPGKNAVEGQAIYGDMCGGVPSPSTSSSSTAFTTTTTVFET